MNTKYKWLVIVLIAVMVIVVVVRSGKVNDPAGGDGIKDRTIAILAYERPKDPNNLKTIKIASVAVAPDGSLTLRALKPEHPSIEGLERAIADISGRETLELTSENEEIIDGHRALVMRAEKVSKTDPAYIYAIRETLVLEFGLWASLER